MAFRARKKELGTGYGFRNQYYVVVEVRLFKDGPTDQICLDTGCSVTLIDRQFLKRLTPFLKLRTLPKAVAVRNIGSDKYNTSEFGILNLFFPGRTVGTTGIIDALAKILCEIYVVDNLKANILIGMDVLGPKEAFVDIDKKEVYFPYCLTHSPIRVTPRGKFIKQIIKVRERIIVPPNTQITIPVYYANVLEGRDYLFEPANSKLTLYAHLADAHLSAIMARNTTDRPVIIPRNTHLGHFTELEYQYTYAVNIDDVDLAVRPPKQSHRTNWVKSTLKAFTTAALLTVPSAIVPQTNLSAVAEPSPLLETMLTNGATVHNSPETVAKVESVINAYSDLQKDQGFIKLPKDNWMRIPLKSN